jgi:hypothetical protein
MAASPTGLKCKRFLPAWRIVAAPPAHTATNTAPVSPCRGM